jgi:hypothetical protein
MRHHSGMPDDEEAVSLVLAGRKEAFLSSYTGTKAAPSGCLNGF